MVHACSLGDAKKAQLAPCACTSEVFANVRINVAVHKAAHEYARQRDDTVEQNQCDYITLHWNCKWEAVVACSDATRMAAVMWCLHDDRCNPFFKNQIKREQPSHRNSGVVIKGFTSCVRMLTRGILIACNL